MNPSINTVAISDGHNKMRECLMHLLTLWGYQVIFLTPNHKDLLIQISEQGVPDICIIGTKITLSSELECCKNIKEKYPHIKIIILTMHSGFKIAQIFTGFVDAIVCKSGLEEIKTVLNNFKNVSQ